MSTLDRVRLSRSRMAAGTEAVYQHPDSLEVESTVFYEVTRRRVFFDDVLLVTYHREAGPLYLILTAIIGLILIAIAVAILAADTAYWPAASVFVVFGLPVLVLFFIRLVYGLDVITVFGRRSKAVLRFGMRKARAREVYGQICAAVRRAQATPPAPESPAPPLPADVPLPPP